MKKSKGERMEPRRTQRNPVIRYEIDRGRNDALILIYGPTRIRINKDTMVRAPSGKSYEQRHYGWNIVTGYDRIEDGNRTIYRLEIDDKSLDVEMNSRGEVLSVGLRPTEYVYLPLECLVNLHYFGVYGVLIGVEFVVTRNERGKETFKLINRLLKLKPERVRELVGRQISIQRDRFVRGDGVSSDIEVMLEPHDYEVVEVEGIPDKIESCDYYDKYTIRGEGTLNNAIEYVDKSIQKIERNHNVLSDFSITKYLGSAVQPIQQARPVQRNIVLNEGEGFNNMNTMLRGQTGTFTRVVSNNTHIVTHIFNGMQYIVKEGQEVIEETRYVNGQQVGAPRRYARNVNTILDQQPLQSAQYLQHGTQRMNQVQQPVQPRREPIMRNVPTDREVINVDEESEDSSVYSHPIGPERRPVAQMRPMVQPRTNQPVPNQPVQRNTEQSAQGTQMEEETEEENQSITEEEPQLTIQQPVIQPVQSTQTMSDDSDDTETESDSETIEVNWN